MFDFLKIFNKGNSAPIPTIRATKAHKADNKKEHSIFLSNLEELLKASNLFKSEYIKRYVKLYMPYKPFMGHDLTLIIKQTYFLESLTEEAKKYKNNEVKKYVKNIIVISSNRASSKVSIERLQVDGLVRKIVFHFPNNDQICESLKLEKKKYNKKEISVFSAPVFPLSTCIKCSGQCRVGVFYKSVIDGF